MDGKKTLFQSFNKRPRIWWVSRFQDILLSLHQEIKQNPFLTRITARYSILVYTRVHVYLYTHITSTDIASSYQNESFFSIVTILDIRYYVWKIIGFTSQTYRNLQRMVSLYWNTSSYIIYICYERVKNDSSLLLTEVYAQLFY